MTLDIQAIKEKSLEAIHTPEAKQKRLERHKEFLRLQQKEDHRLNPKNHTIDYEKELERHDLSPRQREGYRDIMKKKKRMVRQHQGTHQRVVASKKKYNRKKIRRPLCS